jgi:hypothetical protein
MMHESQDRCRSRANPIYLNVALFGLTVKQQRDANSTLDANMPCTLPSNNCWCSPTDEA